jgi:tRNA (guanine-N7-)-methyltransferase
MRLEPDRHAASSALQIVEPHDPPESGQVCTAGLQAIGSHQPGRIGCCQFQTLPDLRRVTRSGQERGLVSVTIQHPGADLPGGMRPSIRERERAQLFDVRASVSESLARLRHHSLYRYISLKRFSPSPRRAWGFSSDRPDHFTRLSGIRRVWCVRMSRVLNTQGIAIDPAELENLQWARLFGNQHPVEIEIGTGKGGFLLRRAQAYPERNFLGIEWANQFFRFAADRLRRWSVTNVRMVRADAAHFMRVQCPRESVSALHVYHPDPWPKKRHHKRRLFQKPFVDAAVACLVPGGRWAVQTDHAEYFQVISDLLRSHPELEEIDFDDPDFGIDAGSIASNFEVKYLREGRQLYHMALVRRPQT